MFGGTAFNSLCPCTFCEYDSDGLTSGKSLNPKAESELLGAWKIVTTLLHIFVSSLLLTAYWKSVDKAIAVTDFVL